MSEKRRSVVMYELQEMSGEEIAQVLATRWAPFARVLNAARCEFSRSESFASRAVEGRALRQETS